MHPYVPQLNDDLGTWPQFFYAARNKRQHDVSRALVYHNWGAKLLLQGRVPTVEHVLLKTRLQVLYVVVLDMKKKKKMDFPLLLCVGPARGEESSLVHDVLLCATPRFCFPVSSCVA